VHGTAVVVGVGGLGAPAAAALAAAAVPRLRLIDPDAVELSNLPRQPLYGCSDLGAPKVEAAARRLRALSASLDVEPCAIRLDVASAAELLRGADVVLDGSDNLATKDLLNATALELGIALVHAGAVGLGGQLMTILPQRSACLRCLFPELRDGADLPTCQEAGILGPVVGAVGFAAASEALSVLRGAPPALVNRLAIFDGAQLRWRSLELRPNPRCPACRAAAQLASAPAGSQYPSSPNTKGGL
jgi:molybdopterin/thiamine biosynthesis adenylyltransferase